MYSRQLKGGPESVVRVKRQMEKLEGSVLEYYVQKTVTKVKLIIIIE